MVRNLSIVWPHEYLSEWQGRIQGSKPPPFKPSLLKDYDEQGTNNGEYVNRIPHANVFFSFINKCPNYLHVWNFLNFDLNIFGPFPSLVLD